MFKHRRCRLLVLRRVIAIGCLLPLGLITSRCGGRDSATASPTFELSSFQLTDVTYGRAVVIDGVEEVVNPWTYAEHAGDALDITLLNPDDRLDSRPSLALGPGYVPRLLPRNATLVLQFTSQIDPTSLVLDRTEEQPPTVQILDWRGKPQALEATVHGRQLWLQANDPITGAFSPSPLSLDFAGRPQFAANGSLSLILSDGPNALRSLTGKVLTPRQDGLGRPDSPIRFHSGNRLTDLPNMFSFELRDGVELPNITTTRGFLPDRVPPRILRVHELEHVMDDDAGDFATSDEIVVGQLHFSDRANAGNGEWAGAALVLRPGEPNEVTFKIHHNDRQRLQLAAPMNAPPRTGERWVLRRTETYEPDPNAPISPATYDPENPQNFRNSQLIHFLEAYEIDATGQPFGEPLSLREPLPSHSELRVRFSEVMDLAGVSPWENLQVRPRPETASNDHFVSRVVCRDNGRTLAIQPVLEDPLTGDLRSVGWGPGVRTLDLVLTTIVPIAQFRGLQGADLAAGDPPKSESTV